MVCDSFRYIFKSINQRMQELKKNFDFTAYVYGKVAKN